MFLSQRNNMAKSEKQLTKKQKIISYILRDIALFGGVAIILVIVDKIFGYACPTKLILDFDCPFCGMTRAHLAALRLDFKAAFEYHPLFFLGVPFIFIITHDELFTGKYKKLHTALVVALTALFLINYAIKLCFIYM